MNIKQTFASLALLCSALSSTAQTDEFRIGRSEYVPEEATTRSGAPRRIGSQDTAPIKAQGEPNIPIVLVQFADTKFTIAEGDDALKDYYTLYGNGDSEGGGAGNNLGGIRNYFAAQSDSAFMPNLEVAAVVTMSNDLAYYGTNEGSRDRYYQSRFIPEALSLAQEQYGTDWSHFDNDGDGAVEMVFFVFAGVGENYGGDANSIWPKQVTTTQTVNGVRYNAFCCDSELGRGGVGNGIGVFVHEFSHALGLPDLYLTSGSGYVPGMDLWSVMDYGQYAGNGLAPMGYTAYERDFMGWQELEELTEPQIVTLLPFARGGKGYKVVNDQNPDEYYILENKQAEGWERALRSIGTGLLIYHVDYNASAWNTNRVNNDANHQRMTFIPASNSWENIIGNAANSADWFAALAGHLYPGTTQNYNLTNETLPASVVFTGDYMSKPIRNIEEGEDGVITLCFRTNGQLAAPVIDESAATDTSLSVKWAAIDNATQYRLVLVSDGDTLSTVVTDTEHTFQGLGHSTQFTLTVQALADSEEDWLASAQSEPLTISTVVTSIEKISTHNSALSTQTFDLSGRRMDAERMQRGLYIRNGKKIIIE